MKIILVTVLILNTATHLTALDDRIVGGEIAENGEFPYEVSLRYLGSHICGATIISQQWIMTAAHCVKGFDASLMSIVAGTNTLNQGGEIYRVDKYIYHENYASDYDTAIFDIAVIKLKSEIIFTNIVQPIPLNTQNISSGSNLIISGWGITKYPSSIPSNVLKYLELNALETKECQKEFEELGYEVNDKQLCAYSQYGEGACSGDSGSPLVFNGRVAGIASWVEPCGIGYPDVYTRVSSYVDWIRNKTDDKY